MPHNPANTYVYTYIYRFKNINIHSYVTGFKTAHSPDHFIVCLVCKSAQDQNI